MSSHLGALAAAAVRPELLHSTPVLVTRDLAVAFHGRTVLSGIDFGFLGRRVTSIVGPSGCGKTTLLRALNRMHDFTRGAEVTGTVELAGQDLYSPDVDPIAVRRRVGMVFQRPNPFPTMSIEDNVAAGLRLAGVESRRDAWADAVEACLRRAALWDEVKDRLKRPAMGLSGGQQQRLCIARALSMEPDVILMDEPCSALDPIATLHIEELILQLRADVTIIAVTHNLQQAARISDELVFMLGDESGVGHIVESGHAVEIFSQPADPRTEAYLTGRMG